MRGTHERVDTAGNTTTHNSLCKYIVRCNAPLAARCTAVVDTACRVVQGDLLEPRGSVDDRLDHSRRCHVHLQRCHGDIRALPRLLNQLEAEVDKSVHMHAFSVRIHVTLQHHRRGR